jgi:hypothetical protein
LLHDRVFPRNLYDLCRRTAHPPPTENPFPDDFDDVNLEAAPTAVASEQVAPTVETSEQAPLTVETSERSPLTVEASERAPLVATELTVAAPGPLDILETSGEDADYVMASVEEELGHNNLPEDDGDGQEMDVDDAGEETDGGDGGEDDDMEIDGDDSVSAACEKLLKYMVFVDPVHNWTICTECEERYPHEHIRQHRYKHHRIHRNNAHRLPSPPTFTSWLKSAHADNPHPMPSGPIELVPCLKVVHDAVRCDFAGCGDVLSGRKMFLSHCQSVHNQKAADNPKFTVVQAHPMGAFRSSRKYVEIVKSLNPNNLKHLAAILSNYEKLEVGKPNPVYAGAQNPRAKTALLFRTGWDIPLIGVDVKKLRATVGMPNEKKEPGLFRLKRCAREYYTEIGDAVKMRRLAKITLRHINSHNPEQVLSFRSLKKMLTERLKQCT